MYNSPYQSQPFNGRPQGPVVPNFSGAKSAVKPGMAGPNLNQPGGMTTTVDEINAGGPKPVDNSAYNANYNMLTGQNAPGAAPQVDDRGGGNAPPLSVSGEMMPGQPGGRGQPAMPQFNLGGRDNPRAGMRPGSPNWAQASTFYQNLRKPNQPPKPNPYQIDPYEGGNIVGPAQPNRF